MFASARCSWIDSRQDRRMGQFRKSQNSMLPETIGRSVCYHYSTPVAVFLTIFVGHPVNNWFQRKRQQIFQFSQEDGGGLFPTPDRSQADRSQPDVFQSLRHSWIQHIIHNRLDQALLQHIVSDNPNPPFSDEVLQPFRHDLEQFLRAHDETPDWTVREHQPMHLNILEPISKIMGDRDTSLFPSLQAGVKTGFQRDIPLSGIFPIQASENLVDNPLCMHMQNWQSAESDLELTQSLVNEELEKGWVLKYPGTLAEAQAEYPLGVSVGKLGIALSDSRPPRLVVDTSICGLNARCFIPERSTLPTAKEVLRSYPLRGTSEALSGFSLDIKSAHKRIVIHPTERGLVGFSPNGDIYFYDVTPFGATFSAAWWSRLGGFFLRCFHHLIWWAHCGFLYVDDFLFFMRSGMMPLAAALCCISCQLTGIPISWKKCELGSIVNWIGWQFNFRSGTVQIPTSKIQKLQGYLQDLLRLDKCKRKQLEKIIGLLMWITQLFPLLRIWIHYLYTDLYSIPATHFSVDPGDWSQLHHHLSSDLHVTTRPPGTAIPIGGKLLSERHKEFQSKEGLHNFRPSPEKRIWLRIRDPNSSRRSHHCRCLFLNWTSVLQPIRSMTPKRYWSGHAAADACASGNTCRIGGFIQHESGKCLWFSEQFYHSDFAAVSLHLEPEMQKSIASFETLAQIALAHLISKNYPGSRMPICLKSLSDNSGAESVSNKLFTTSKPLCFFVGKLTLLATMTGTKLDVSHIPGQDNEIADQWSRWDEVSDIPFEFNPDDRVRFILPHLWNPDLTCSLHPNDAYIL